MIRAELPARHREGSLVTRQAGLTSHPKVDVDVYRAAPREIAVLDSEILPRRGAAALLGGHHRLLSPVSWLTPWPRAKNVPRSRGRNGLRIDVHPRLRCDCLRRGARLLSGYPAVLHGKRRRITGRENAWQGGNSSFGVRRDESLAIGGKATKAGADSPRRAHDPVRTQPLTVVRHEDEPVVLDARRLATRV